VPGGITGNDRYHLGDAADRQSLETFTRRYQRRTLEAFRLSWNDPEIGLRVIDDRRDHALEAEKDSDLNGDEHNGKDNSDDRGDQSNPVMKKIARCERENHRVKKRREKRNTQGIGIVGKPWNVIVLNPLNLNMNIIRGRYLPRCRICASGRSRCR
jgi:hypothetical protein